MKAFKPQIIVIPHFIGTSKQTEVFKKVITATAEKKLRDKNDETNDNNDTRQKTA